MTEKKKTALVLEGGGNRGIFTAGVLDYLMEQELTVDYVTGVSAGACNAVDFVSGQIGRTKDCMLGEDGQYPVVSLRNAIRNKSLFDMDLLFERFPNEIYPFDYDTYFSSRTDCELVVTNCRTGQAEYFSERRDRQRLMDICRASSSLPAVSPMVSVDGQLYLDGGIADSIPLIHSLKKGHRKNIVILTRNEGYRKKRPGKSRAFYMAAFRDYPRLANTILNRYRNYNHTLDLIEKWEKEGHIFVIRPEMKPVGRAERNREALEEFYRHGYDLAKERWEALREYLER